MSLSVIRASWPMVKDLWALRLEAMREEGSEPTDLELVARLRWETQGQLLNEKFLVIMAYDDLQPVGYITLAQGDFTGINAQHGFYVVGYFVRPEYRRGSASTRIGLAVGRVLEQMKVPRLQGIVQPGNILVASMLKRHGFREVGTVYERSGHVESVERREDRQEIHRAGGEHAHIRANGHVEQPVVPVGSAACDAGRPEPAQSVA